MVRGQDRDMFDRGRERKCLNMAAKKAPPFLCSAQKAVDADRQYGYNTVRTHYTMRPRRFTHSSAWPAEAVAAGQSETLASFTTDQSRPTAGNGKALQGAGATPGPPARLLPCPCLTMAPVWGCTALAIVLPADWLAALADLFFFIFFFLFVLLAPTNEGALCTRGSVGLAVIRALARTRSVP